MTLKALTNIVLLGSAVSSFPCPALPFAFPPVELLTKLPEHFDVSVAFLIGEAPGSPDESQEFIAMYRDLKGLTENDRATIRLPMKEFKARGKRKVKKIKRGPTLSTFLNLPGVRQPARKPPGEAHSSFAGSSIYPVPCRTLLSHPMIFSKCSASCRQKGRPSQNDQK